MPARVLVLLAPGAEEIEVVTPVDVLRRAGVEVVMAGLEGRQPVRCSRGVTLVPDQALDEVTGTFDLVLVPGGKQGSELLAASRRVGDLLRGQAAAGRKLAAICAGPTVLLAHGVGEGRTVTSHPSAQERLSGPCRYVERPVVVDGNLITSRGPGSAMAMALELVRQLCGAEAARAVAGPLQLAPAEA